MKKNIYSQPVWTDYAKKTKTTKEDDQPSIISTVETCIFTDCYRSIIHQTENNIIPAFQNTCQKINQNNNFTFSSRTKESIHNLLTKNIDWKKHCSNLCHDENWTEPKEEVVILPSSKSSTSTPSTISDSSISMSTTTSDDGVNKKKKDIVNKHDGPRRISNMDAIVRECQVNTPNSKKNHNTKDTIQSTMLLCYQFQSNAITNNDCDYVLGENISESDNEDNSNDEPDDISTSTSGSSSSNNGIEINADESKIQNIVLSPSKQKRFANILQYHKIKHNMLRRQQQQKQDSTLIKTMAKEPQDIEIALLLGKTNQGSIKEDHASSHSFRRFMQTARLRRNQNHNNNCIRFQNINKEDTKNNLASTSRISVVQNVKYDIQNENDMVVNNKELSFTNTTAATNTKTTMDTPAFDYENEKIKIIGKWKEEGDVESGFYSIADTPYHNNAMKKEIQQQLSLDKKMTKPIKTRSRMERTDNGNNIEHGKRQIKRLDAKLNKTMGRKNKPLDIQSYDGISTDAVLLNVNDKQCQIIKPTHNEMESTDETTTTDVFSQSYDMPVIQEQVDNEDETLDIDGKIDNQQNGDDDDNNDDDDDEDDTYDDASSTGAVHNPYWVHTQRTYTTT